MHELNNAAKDASLSVYFQPGMSRASLISRYDNGTYTRIQFLRAVGGGRPLRWIASLCPEDGSAESDVDDDDNHDEVSVDDQPSADVGSQDLCAKSA